MPHARFYLMYGDDFYDEAPEEIKRDLDDIGQIEFDYQDETYTIKRIVNDGDFIGYGVELMEHEDGYEVEIFDMNYLRNLKDESYFALQHFTDKHDMYTWPKGYALIAEWE